MDKIPTTVDQKYEVLEKISEGGMGSVYKVRHRLLERVRVIKVMRPQLVADAGMQTRFIREARLAGSLRHPSIAQVYDFAMDADGQAYLVMELIDGFTLEEIQRSVGIPSVAFTLEVVCQTLDALLYLHEKGIIHRDLSPDNVMVCRSPDGGTRAKLIDLGIAKLVESQSTLTAAGSFIGKVRYASPEWFKRDEGLTIDQASDLYSLGVVLYELLTARHPYGEQDVSGFIAGHLFHEPEPFSSSDTEGRVPPELRALVRQTLAKRPDERPPSAAVLEADLRLILERMETPQGELDDILRSCVHAAGESTPATPEHLAPSGSIAATDLRALLEDVGFSGTPRPDATPPFVATQPVADDKTEMLPATRDEPRPRPSIRRAGILGAVVIAAVAAAVVLIGTLQHSPGPAPVQPGVIQLDAVPWAQVESIIAEDGERVALAPDTTTPTRLELPSGRYRVALTDGSGSSRELDVEVTPGSTVSRTAAFEPVSAEEFLASVGLDRPQK